MGGSNENEGRLEIYHSEQWGTVCDDYFTAEDADVVCRQLGLGFASSIITDDSFGNGRRQLTLRLAILSKNDIQSGSSCRGA